MRRALPLFLTLLSGAAGVGHQLVWTRRLVDVLGASSETFSKVVAAFFLGLAAGAWLSARSLLPSLSPWRRVALAEFAVAVLAIPVLCLPQLDTLARSLNAPVAKLLLPLLLVTPPALAMGLIVPWMIRASSHAGSRFPIWLYATNTVGGVAVIPITLLWLLPRLGLTGASAVLISLNIIVALAAAMLSFRTATKVELEQSAAADMGWLNSPQKLIAFASGFLVLALEVVLQHQVAQVTINSLFSSGTVLALVLVSLAVAAMVVPWLAQRLGARAMPCALTAAALMALAQPFLLLAARPGLNILPYELTPLPYLAEVLKLGAMAVMPAVVASGLIFPLLLHEACGDARAIGKLLAWNGLGGWLGAELMQAFIAPRLGLWGSVAFIAAGYAVIFLVTTRPRPSGETMNSLGGGILSKRFHAIISITLLALVGLVAWATQRLPQATINPGERLVQAQVSREGVVATVECGPDDWRILFNNSYTLGGSRAQFNQERQAHVPLLLHGHAERVACLGIATGSTVAGASLHDSVQSIDAIELSPVVVAHARQFFGPYNRHVLADQRVRVMEEDARYVMAQRTAAYDVILGDLFLPWRTGEARLFTIEHFANVRRALKPGGLYFQWLPLFQLTRAQFESIAHTFQTIFPEAFLVRGDFYSDLPIIGLVGGRDLKGIDWPGVAKHCADLRERPDVHDPLVRHAEGVAMMVLGPLPPLPRAPLNTLGNAWLEWDAGENILGLRTPWFIGVPEAEFVREAHRNGIPYIPEGLRPAHDSGQFFLTLEIAARLNLPALPQLESQINDRLPLALRTDRAANWRQWPSRVKPQ